MPDDLTAPADPPSGDRPLDPEKLLRLAGLVRAVLEEQRQMEPEQQTVEELAALHKRVSEQIAEGLPNILRSELASMDLGQPFGDGARPQEVRIAYAGLIGWLGGLFQGLQAAMQFQQLQQSLALQPGQDNADHDHAGRTGQYL
jgi:Protein of unknown function (DUF2587)